MSWVSTPFGHDTTNRLGPNMNHALALLLAKGVLGTGLVVGLAVAPHAPTAHAAPAGVDAYAYEVEDDNGDGIIMEDESGWDCTAQGVPAGDYSEEVVS